MICTKNINGCWECYFYHVTMDGMECSHPYWNGKGAYDNMIITQDNKLTFPDKCPLLKEPLVIEYRAAVK